jgi:flagellar motility protein MotE (MotC chaperone)
MKSLTRIFVASLIFGKVVLGSIFLYHMDVNPLFLEKNAIASEQQQDIQNAADESKDIVHQEKIDLDFLLKMKAELKTQEEELAKKKAELVEIQGKINEDIAKLSQLRDEIRARIAIQKEVEDEKLKHLIKAYSTMKPQKAATLIEKLDMAFAIELLSNMKGDAVGNILSFVDTERAARISEQLARRE